MDPVLFAAIKAGEKLVHLVTVSLPGYTIRWALNGGFVRWDGSVWRGKDATYGVLESIGEIADGVGDDSSPVELVIIPPSLASAEDLAAADAQGGIVTIHMGAVSRQSGLLIGEPYRVHIGELDRPTWKSRSRRLIYDIITTEARGLEANEEQRQSHAFHSDIWPGELGYVYQTDGTKLVFWRDDDPNNAIGFISPKKKKGGDPYEFTYETDAGWPFPFGRTNVKGTVNGRFGFGPTNRFNSIFFTVAASGPIQNFLEFYANDELTNFGAGDVAIDGEHAGEMWLQRKLGTQPQTALTVPASIGFTPSEWTADHKMSGKSCGVLTMKENSKNDEYNGGVPTVESVVEGLLGWDDRSPGCDLDDPTTWIFMENGPIAALNWTIGRWEGPSTGGGYGVPYLSKMVGGIGSPIDGIDVAAHLAAADLADANGWTVSHCPTSADDKHQVRKDLLASAACEPALICGRISLVCNAAILDSAMTVTNADTAGDVTTEKQASRLDRRNLVFAKFKSEANRWEMATLEPVGDPDWQTQDGGRRAVGLSFPTAPGADQAAQLGYLEVVLGRALSGEAPFKPYMMALEPGMAFTWDEPEFLMVEVKVQVRTRSYDPMTGIVKTGYRRHADEDIEAALSQVGVAPPASGDYIPPVYVVEGPGMFSATDLDATTVELTWRNPSALNFDHIKIYRAEGSTNFIDAMAIGSDVTGGLGAVMVENDVPGMAGVYSYWLKAFDTDGNDSAPEGPQTATI